VSNVKFVRVLLQQPLFSGDVGVPRLVVVSPMIGWVLLPVWLKLRERRDEENRSVGSTSASTNIRRSKQSIVSTNEEVLNYGKSPVGSGTVIVN
jgi:hypothetical protein